MDGVKEVAAMTTMGHYRSLGGLQLYPSPLPPHFLKPIDKPQACNKKTVTGCMDRGTVSAK